MRPVLAVAHRAGNDPAAVQRALALGVDVLEADVHRYRGLLELRHSKVVRPLPLLYDAGRWTSTARPRPLLQPLLEAVGNRATVLLDLKGPGAVGRHVADALRARPSGPPVLVCSRWWPSLTPLRGGDGARPVLTARTPLEVRRLLHRVHGAAPPYGVSVHRSLLTPLRVAALRSRVELVLTWPVNDHDALEAVLALGVNGVISDEAAVLRSVRELPRPRGTSP